MTVADATIPKTKTGEARSAPPCDNMPHWSAATALLLQCGSLFDDRPRKFDSLTL